MKIFDLTKLVGLTENEALTLIKNENLIPRICQKDDIKYLCTRDYRINRVNLYFKNGKVIKANFG